MQTAVYHEPNATEIELADLRNYVWLQQDLATWARGKAQKLADSGNIECAAALYDYADECDETAENYRTVRCELMHAAWLAVAA